MVEIFGGRSISPGAAKSIRLALTLSKRSIIVKSLDQLPASAEHDLSQLLEQGAGSTLWQLQRTGDAYEFAVSLSAQVDCSSLKRFDRLHENDLAKINLCLAKADALKRPIIGFLFRGAAIEQLSQQINIEAGGENSHTRLPADIPAS